MKRARSFWVATLLVVATVGAAAVAVAQPAGGPPAEKRHHRWESKLQQRLGLTDDQAQQIRQIHQRDADARRQHYQALRQARAELRALVLDNADPAAIEAKQMQVQQLLSQSVEMRVRTLREIAPILTVEQREKMKQMGGERGRHFRRHRGSSES